MKKNFKVLALILVVALALSVMVAAVACKDKEEDVVSNEVELPPYNQYTTKAPPAGFKVGLICLHDENSTYDKNFIDAMHETQKLFGLSNEQVIIATGVDESIACYNKAIELADAGCNVIFADSFGHEPHMINAAKQRPNVQFCHATGTRAHTEGVANYANAFASIYEGRYLAGVAAGMKLNEMIAAGQFTAAEAKIGYVGAWTYAEVISGYTSFFLGARSICPSATMEVTFTGSWYDETMEREAANQLIGRGCKLISQHADSMGAPNACEEKGVPNVSYNGSTVNACPNTFIISSRIDWSPYYNYVLSQVIKGEAVAHDWVGTIENGGVKLTNLGAKAMAKGTVEKIVEIRGKLVSGEIHVFDTNKFTYKNKEGQSIKMESYLADVHSDEAFTPDTEVIHEDGYFQESVFRSAPYFDVTIDGITLLNTKF
ncbi:MAG TPA: BMP family ABC transporter substrate-binding protein [Clostridia bacterium]|jgi:basic membrane protein A|nr:BMP family ABC transporter substrate-binding protein [Clostridia bacterium]